MRNSKAKTSVPTVPSRLLPKDELLELLGVGYSAVFTWMRDNDFPRALELGPPGGRTTKIAWLESEVHAWILARPRRQFGRHEFRGRPAAEPDHRTDSAPAPRKRKRIDDNDHGELCPIPRDWRTAHGSARTNLRGYRNVQVRSAALLGRFPEERTPLASAEWAAAATRKLQDEKKIPKGMLKSELARLLEIEAQKAVKTGDIRRALKASYLEDQLRPWGIWPLK